MFKLRQEQVEVVVAETARQHARSLIESETRAFLEANGDQYGRAEVRACIERVTARGVTRSEGVRRYLEIALAHGLAFEADPALAWLAARLDDRDISSPDQRIARAYGEWKRRAAIAAENERREQVFGRLR
jgi:hypothetical protein